MKSKIAVTDACIFIDLADTGLLAGFFELEIAVHTSALVLHELYPTQQALLETYQSQNKLVVHNLHEQDFEAIHAAAYSRSLSEADKSVLYLAFQLDAWVLSSDKAVRLAAKNKKIDYHGMLWVLDQLVQKALITPKEAADKLKTLVDTNYTYQNNPQLLAEIAKRLNVWIQ